MRVRGRQLATPSSVIKCSESSNSGNITLRSVVLCKDFLGCEQAVECSRKASIDRHLHDDFDDFLLGAANVPSAVDVDFELRRSIAQRGERRHNSEFPGPKIETGPRIDVPKWKLNEQACKVGSDVAQTFNDIFASLAIDLLQLGPAPQIAFVVHIRSFVLNSERTVGLAMQRIQYHFCDTFSV